MVESTKNVDGSCKECSSVIPVTDGALGVPVFSRGNVKVRLSYHEDGGIVRTKIWSEV